MNNGVFNLLGLCRRANKLSMGHDTCKDSIKSGRAQLCLVSSDSSERVFEEMKKLCEDKKIPLFRIPSAINDIHKNLGYKAGIITVNDSGFAESAIKKIKTEYTAEEE